MGMLLRGHRYAHMVAGTPYSSPQPQISQQPFSKPVRSPKCPNYVNYNFEYRKKNRPFSCAPKLSTSIDSWYCMTCCSCIYQNTRNYAKTVDAEMKCTSFSLKKKKTHREREWQTNCKKMIFMWFRQSAMGALLRSQGLSGESGKPSQRRVEIAFEAHDGATPAWGATATNRNSDNGVPVDALPDRKHGRVSESPNAKPTPALYSLLFLIFCCSLPWSLFFIPWKLFASHPILWLSGPLGMETAHFLKN